MVKKYKIGPHISNEPDLVLEEQLLLTPGLWGGVKFTPEEIIKGIRRTNWQNPENSSILGYHPKRGELPLAEAWVGDLKNVRYLTLEDGVKKEGMYGDVFLYDPIFAKKIAVGKAKLAFSIDTPYQMSRYGAKNLTFSKTAIVYRPGCKDAYIQLSDKEDDLKMRFISDELGVQLSDEVTSDSSKGSEGEEYSNEKVKRKELEDMEEETFNLGEMVKVYNKEGEFVLKGEIIGFESFEDDEKIYVMDENGEIMEFEYEGNAFEKEEEEIEEKEEDDEEIMLEEVTAMEEKRKEMGMTVSEFYAAPRDPPSSSALPIFDESHVKNAMARFNQTEFNSESEKIKARAKILRKAKSYEIDASNFKEQSQLACNSKKYKKKSMRKQLSESTEDKKGEDSRVMDEKNQETTVVEEQKKEVPKEESTEKKVEEPVKEEKSESTDSTENVVKAEVADDSKDTKVEEKKEVAQPAKEIVDNSEKIGELNTKFDSFEKSIDEKFNSLKETILEMAKPKEEVKEETTEVKKPAQTQTRAQVEDNEQDDLSNLTPFERAHARINSK